MSFSRDGSQIAFASLEWRSTLLKQNFDAAKEILLGPPTPILKGSRPIRDHEISPDGNWIAFNESRTQEDLFVTRSDGTQYRRLTEDAARDRGPAWSPDGKKIVFYTDRGGRYDLWTIRPEGGQPEQITKDASANFAVWSPDGNRIAFSGIGMKGMTIVDANAHAKADLPAEPQMGANQDFWPFSWTRDGARLAGVVRTPTGGIGGLAIYDVGTKQYRSVKTPHQTLGWEMPLWLADDRRILVRSASGIAVINPETGASKTLVMVRGYSTGRSLSLARDNTWFSYTETGTEGDVWIAVLGKK